MNSLANSQLQNLNFISIKEALIISTPESTQQYCNRCGRPLDFWDLQEDFSIHKYELGYGTKHDGDSVDLQLCCDCFDKLVEECAISPIKER